MADWDDSSRRRSGRGALGGVAIPLPPPDEDGSTRVRIREYIADDAADVPALLGDTSPATSPAPEDTDHDRTIVDPYASSRPSRYRHGRVRDFDPDSKSPAPDDSQTLDEETTGVTNPTGPEAAPAGEPAAKSERPAGSRLPLPPPAATGQTRAAPPPRARPNPPVRRHDDAIPRPAGRVLLAKHKSVEVDERDRSTAIAHDPLAPMRTQLVGGRYHIVGRIGEGGMGKVYKVTHAQLGKTFALKVISGDLAADARTREGFYREARMASSLSHPNVATVVDFGEDATLGAFMVMELLEGEALSKILFREKRLSVRVALDYIQQIGEALHYIHSSGIVHCDIKTDNILICELPGTKRRTKQVKLLDFGLARSTSGLRNNSKLSGTPQYVAPERIRGAKATPSSDIYGLGILLYELVTGQVPWNGSIEHILGGHLDLEPTPPSELLRGMDPALEKLILRALAKSPEDRHKDMAAFLYELRTVEDMLGYGRKRAGRKVVVGKPQGRREDVARRVFDACRVPMAVIDRSGVIALANAAFAKFVMGLTVSVEGLQVQATPLTNSWRSFEEDLARACSGISVQRILEVDAAGGRTRRLLIWLDPGLDNEQVMFGVHPLDM